MTMDSIVSDPEILGGTPVFKGTRLPVKTLLDYLISGVSNLQDFLEDYPSVNLEDAKQVIEALGAQLLDFQRLAA
jgi:uncharacterized protein (DUF433 family)